jgi:hypothetical protein
MQDVRVARGADVGSDQHLVVIKLRLKLKRNANKEQPRVRYDITTLSNPQTREEFQLALRNRFDILAEPLEPEAVVQSPAENSWEQIKNTFNTTCEQVLGRKRRCNKEWISQETLKLIEARRQLKQAYNNSRTRGEKARAQRDYSEAHRAVKRSVRGDKRAFYDTLAREAEEAAARRDMKTVYQITKQLSGKFLSSGKPIKSKDGRVLTTTGQQLTRWAEHFRQLLNRPPPEDDPNIPVAPVDLPINVDRPTREEIRTAIIRLKNGKAAGPDDIPAEALKADIDTAAEVLYTLFGDVWDSESIPKDWKQGILVKVPKKGDLQECNNYRGISLLSVPGKVFCRVLLDRMTSAVNERLRDEQAGFRAGRSCTDHIATLENHH